MNGGILKKVALDYLTRGISVIPVGFDKRPLIKWAEFQERRATVEEVETWWKNWPDAQIGIVTGKISNFIVVDVEKGGDSSYLPQTATAKTGGGGYHYYYAYVEFNNKARIRELTDIRGDGGYVIAPPSKSSKGDYSWFRQIHPLPFFPKHLFGDSSAISSSDWKRTFEGVGKGERNHTAASVIGKLLRTFNRKEDLDAAWQAVVGWNSQNDPPMNERELRTTFDSISRRAFAGEKMEEVIAEHEEDVPIMPIGEIARKKLMDKRETYQSNLGDFDDYLKRDSEKKEGGFKDGDLVVISGHTGNGKTTLAQNLTYNFYKQGLMSLWFSFEVDIVDLWEKFTEMGVDEDSIAVAPLENISERIDWIEKKIKEAKEKFFTKFVFIDHLGFLLPKVRELSDNEVARNYSAYLGSMCRSLKSVAIKEEVVIVLMAHIKKTDGEARLNDIANSAGIAQESDVVFLIEREKQFGQEEYGEHSLIKIVKNRKSGKTPRSWFTYEKGIFDQDHFYKPANKEIKFNI